MSVRLLAARAVRILAPVPHSPTNIRTALVLPQNAFFGTTALTCVAFFNKYPAERLWKSVTSVSNAGAKKGRGKGKGRKRSKDLNRGQVIGSGSVNMLWPGLSAPIIRGRELVKQQRLPDDPERMAKIIKMRDSMTSFRTLKLSPIERGFSGTRMPGRKLGPPDPIGEDEFVGFETFCVDLRTHMSMRGNLGRYRRFGAMAVTGNGNGLAGFAVGKSKEAHAALRKARNRAGQKLMQFDIYNGHTIYHNFFSQFGKTKLFAWHKNEGYGLRCHRVVRCICQCIGIKDIHVKIEGSKYVHHIVKAFLIGLLQQKTHQQMAEEKKLHLVEFRGENANYPHVIASPSRVRTADEIDKNEVLDFERYALHDRVVLRRKKWPRFYEKMGHYRVYLKKYEKRRNHESLRHQLKVEYGSIKSFLTDLYPEQTKVERKEG